MCASLEMKLLSLDILIVAASQIDFLGVQAEIIQGNQSFQLCNEEVLIQLIIP